MIARIAHDVAISLGVVAAHGTVLAAIALGLERLGGRRRPSWQAAVWLVVMVKFALPWGPALPWSLADVLAALTDHGGAVAIAPTMGPEVAAVTGAPSLAWLGLIAAWAIGAVIVVARALARERAVRAVTGAAIAAPPAAQEQLAALAARLGVRPPRLVVGAPATGPHVVGLWRPTIVVPPALLSAPALLAAALLHELAHVRRRDAVARLVQLAVAAAFYWWPVARWASRRLDLAREAACDAWALAAGELSRPAYARLLVHMASLHHRAALGAAEGPDLGGALAMARASHLEARVAAVLAAPPRPRVSLAAGLGLIAWIALALGGARTAAARGHAPACVYTAALAAALRQAHPEADLDGDGVLSRDEACELQAGLRRAAEAGPDPIAADRSLLAEPLCCNCQAGEGTSSLDQAVTPPAAVTATCHPGPDGSEGIEGVDR